MKLMIIDGNSIVNRAFYGVRELSTRDGFPTHAIYGFINILMKLIGEEQPDALCVAFDLKAPTFRHLRYEQYKAQRKPMPEELAVQIPVVKEILDAMNIARLEQEGWEADDLIGTVARIDTEHGWETVIVTGDKDSLQLIDRQVRVKLVSTRMGQSTTKDMTPEAFREQYGFEPEQMIDLKALMGDASDNIPGVAGIGEKTAMDLIARCGTVERIYAGFDALELKPAVRKKLDEGREMARLSYELATIQTDAPISFLPENALRRPLDNHTLYSIFARLEFAKLIDSMGLNAPQGAVVSQAAADVLEMEVMDTPARAEELLALWRQREHVAVLALPGLDGVAVCCEKNVAVVLGTKLGAEGYRKVLTALFSSEIKKVSHEVKELMRLLLDEGLSTDEFVFDTALAAYLLAPTDGSYALERLAMSYFNRELPNPARYREPEAFSALGDSAAALEAFAEHAAMVDCLYEAQRVRLAELGMDRLLTELELPLCAVLAEMERIGFLADRKALASFGVMLSTGIESLQSEIYGLAEGEFNINSTKQLGEVLFDRLGLPPVKKTKTGYSTNAEVLEKLRGRHEIIDRILEYRQLTKLNSTYVEGLTKVIAPDGRIHTSFQNTVTATGRLSSTEPNLQNIPIRTKLGAELRHMFIAPEGSVLVDADYSQIELRLLAHISGDPVMIHAFETGTDIHTVTAGQVLGIPPEEVTPAQRSRAKAVNFGIVYGISPWSLSEDIHISVEEARHYIERYFERYAGVRRYMDSVVETAKKEGWVTTLYGRRRWVPELSSANRNTRSFGERVALNTPIQGTAADVIKLAMLRVHRRLKADGLAARLVLQVHDELIVECPEHEAERVKALVKEEMEGAASLVIPLTAEAKAGASWGEAHA
ncbi:MAG: polymerase [Oscillospiraceae bacterium]|nr:polymerase [Oscillospiraceae bacterium]